MWMLPRFPEEVLEEHDETVTVREGRGAIVRRLKDPDGMSMPEFLRYPVETRADWEALKNRWDPADPDRFTGNWDERVARWREQGTMIMLQGPRSPSLFGFVRELMGPERAMCAFHDDPGLVHDMMEFNTVFMEQFMPRVVANTPVSAVYFWEDMAYRGGSLLSPRMFREFMVPRYRRLTDLARQLGVEMILVDSDGDISELIPLWLEAGINGMYPMEVAAGMDVVKLRREYGRDLVMTGGIDKRVLASDRAAIDAELKRTIPVTEKGGYIAHLDHAIPHNVPYENFLYYWAQKKRMLGVG